MKRTFESGWKFAKDQVVNKAAVKKLKQPVHQVRDTFSGVSHTSAYQYGNERTRTPVRDGGRGFPRSPRSLAAHSRESPHERDDSPLPLAALESARGEVREVMLQYTSCADPSESAARRERLRQAELQGQLEESAAQIVRASLARKDTGGSATIPGPSAAPTPTATMRIPAPKRLGPSASKSPDLTARVPIMDRLGPLLDEANSTDKDPTGSLAQKRKPGRPPGRRTTKASPIQGAGSKRRIANAKPPLCRRKITGEVGKSERKRRALEDATPERVPATQRLGPSSQQKSVSREENSHDQMLNSQERLPVSLRLGPAIPHSTNQEETENFHDINSSERVPATQRLGPPLASPTDRTKFPEAVAPKRKPGRPPGRKAQEKTPPEQGAPYPQG
ncbi:hypothetical protein F2Q70_00015079 [Brassica cretica]|uniref:DUF4005 domain-containing protein n=1 Tax=Brassica cretica TaxID=69181 RepID=A0A8S9HXZ8_BRACR|nr:hypothetical protein F2Q70_00015079 [Brassica cretica]